jgi:PhoPQ-activated pathogenicity-related protein
MNSYKKTRFKNVFNACCLLASQTVWGNALEDFVGKKDSEYRWQPTKISKNSWGSISYYDLISQNWRGHSWTHHLLILRPHSIRNPDIALLQLSGDGDGDKQITNLKNLAERGGAVTAVLMNVPNQPFYDNRREDALIAYTLNQYIKTGDETWPLLFPMVKSALKAMDAIQDIVKAEHKQQISRFIMTGASKRGWTAWLSAAVDKRVAAIAPMVIDTLNMKAQLQWSEQIYGQQSSKIKDYTELNLHRKIDSAAMQKLQSWIDPYAYIQRFTMPKLLLLGTNDPYWTVDSLRHYWSELPEPKLIYQTPNAGHDLNGGGQALQTLSAFFELIADRKPLPKVAWRFNPADKDHLTAQLDSNEQASTIRLWSAHSDDRDFRDNQWTAQTLKIEQGSSHAKATIPFPKSGYQANLMELELKTDSGHPFNLSTQVQVSPDTKPCDCWTKGDN